MGTVFRRDPLKRMTRSGRTGALLAPGSSIAFRVARGLPASSCATRRASASAAAAGAGLAALTGRAPGPALAARPCEDGNDCTQNDCDGTNGAT